MIDKVYFKEEAAAMGFSLTEEQLAQFDCYAAMLVEWNEKVNLTAILEPREIVVKHFVDSLCLLGHCQLAQGAHLVDIGTGAGFPAIPVKLYRPDLQITMIDSLGKRIRFLESVATELGLTGVEAIHGRGEDMGKEAAYREKFDLATARAVRGLRELSEYCLPYVKVGGHFVAMKGPDVEEELTQAKNAIVTLGGEVEGVDTIRLPMELTRTFVRVRKVKNTPSIFPRSQGKMSKKPL